MQATGLWRFSFSGTALCSGAVGGSQGNLRLNIDGAQTAGAQVLFQETGGLSPVSFTTIQRVEMSSEVTVQFTGSYCNSGNNIELGDNGGYFYTHFVGEYLGDLWPEVPECEFPGQTFQYPGSCRQYWFCQPDGTVDILDCCPDVYDPNAGACLSEDQVVIEDICPAGDMCQDISSH